MTRYLLPVALLAILAFAAPEARAEHHHHHHGRVGGFGMAAPGFAITAGRLGYGVGLGTGGYAGYGYGYGGYAPAYAPYPAYGYGYPAYALPQTFAMPQSYFASPNYGQWGGFGN